MSPNTNNRFKQIGILGGSFDPVHNAHLEIAEQAFTQMQLNKVFFVPTSISPFKPNPPYTSDVHRLKMLHLAIQNIPHFEVSDTAISRKGVSYCIDTVHEFQLIYSRLSTIYWIIGSDLLPTLHLWKDFRTLITLVQFIVVERPNNPYIIPHTDPDLQLHPIQFKQTDISSTQIRQYFKDHNYSAAKACLPENVYHYITENHLYHA